MTYVAPTLTVKLCQDGLVGVSYQKDCPVEVSSLGLMGLHYHHRPVSHTLAYGKNKHFDANSIKVISLNYIKQFQTLGHPLVRK